jgi:tRNA/rRNA methyltransferase
MIDPAARAALTAMLSMGCRLLATWAGLEDWIGRTGGGRGGDERAGCGDNAAGDNAPAFTRPATAASTLPSPTPDPTRFVLVHTSHAGNVGAAARAMKVMGFSDLVLVRPRFADVLCREETVAMASGAADILVRARVVDTLAEALDGMHLRLRHGDDAARLRPAHLGAAATCRRWPARRTGGLRVRQRALRPGQRRRLPLPHLPEHPHRPDYGSLNLAQAVQLLAYDWRQALGGYAVQPRTARAAAGRPGAVQGALDHWQQALVQLGFLDPAAPKKLMPRLQQLANAPAWPRRRCTSCGAWHRACDAAGSGPCHAATRSPAGRGATLAGIEPRTTATLNT